MTDPTDIHPTPHCSFCGAPQGTCRVLIASQMAAAFICEGCAPAAAKQVAEILNKQDIGGSHD